MDKPKIIEIIVDRISKKISNNNDGKKSVTIASS